MIRKLTIAVSIMLALSLVCLGADISGKWTAQVTGRNGDSSAVTFTFKVDGHTLTGNMSGGPGGDQTLSDGKVSGDTVTFSTEAPRGRRTFTGKISGAEIKFKREGGQTPMEFTAKRATPN